MADRVDQTGTGANPKVRGLTRCKSDLHANRVLLHIILNRLRLYSERQLPEEQTGFRVGRGTRDALFIMQVIIEKLIDLENKELYLIFIDYSKAFDKMDHGRLFDVMLDMGILTYHLVELVAGRNWVY